MEGSFKKARLSRYMSFKGPRLLRQVSASKFIYKEDLEQEPAGSRIGCVGWQV